MARPRKHTIDYFPHFVNPGKTLLILQNEYGNDGYAFWFKLLSLLCKAEGQIYDYNNPAAWRLLLAETHVNGDIATGLLQLLAEIDAIDMELHQRKVIWVQNLVDNLMDVYTRRRNGSVPIRPISVDNIPPTEQVIDNINAVSVNENTQTKPNQRRPDQTIKGTIQLPSYVDETLWHDYLDMRKKLKKPATPRAQELLLKKLGDLHSAGEDANAILRQSIMNSWQGLFPVKREEKDGKAKGRRLPTTYTPTPDYPDL